MTHLKIKNNITITHFSHLPFLSLKKIKIKFPSIILSVCVFFIFFFEYFCVNLVQPNIFFRWINLIKLTVYSPVTLFGIMIFYFTILHCVWLIWSNGIEIFTWLIFGLKWYKNNIFWGQYDKFYSLKGKMKNVL